MSERRGLSLRWRGQLVIAQFNASVDTFQAVMLKNPFLVCQVHFSLSGVCFPVPFPSPVTRGRCEVRKRPGFTGCSQLASTRAALSSPPPAAFRPAVSHTAILAGAPSPGPTSFPLPCRRVLSRSQRLAACRARYLWGTSTGGGLWYSGPWPVFSAFPGVREAIFIQMSIYSQQKIFSFE